MQVDKVTLDDLSLIETGNNNSIFSTLNNCKTNIGASYLQYLLANPLPSIDAITQTQQTIALIGNHLHQWPTSITNGTVMVIEKFYETPIDTISEKMNGFDAFCYCLFSKQDYSLITYSLQCFHDLLQGVTHYSSLLSNNNTPQLLIAINNNVTAITKGQALQDFLHSFPSIKKQPKKVFYFAYLVRQKWRNIFTALIQIAAKYDAYTSMARAKEALELSFPIFQESADPVLHCNKLSHLLLANPVAYDIELQKKQNFLFLTGANMAGKSTFIKAIGVAVYLAHIGMGVPAKHMQLSYFDGLLSNIHVADNLARGESYFFNEVQRIKKTIEKISNGKKWLILIDELFKGTNVQDAMKCSTAVIDGLQKKQNSLFILSTHLYEIGEPLQQYPNMLFRYFETGILNEQLTFSYQLKEGISTDRIGYLILKREGVVQLLTQL